MATLTFDTHDFVKKLKGVGFSEEQAEIITDLQKTTQITNAHKMVNNGRVLEWYWIAEKRQPNLHS
jgi:hypothetical protein